MDTTLMSIIPQLGLTPTAIYVLSVMTKNQEPGGAVMLTQPEIAAELDIDRTQVSRAMGVLTDRGLVVRSNNGKGRSYALNPVIAGYETEADFAQEMQRQLQIGGPPPILLPEYQKAPPRRRGNLHAVAS
ncbi:helix-turn-helix domain-containing protein [Streptomyces sp. NPDC002812]|uniref:helix-turn-helix domain-containing protein n=1 Tax=Streptomyces sp. NPDC002812 TaxID=3154434 RepID=UPI0033278A2B